MDIRVSQTFPKNNYTINNLNKTSVIKNDDTFDMFTNSVKKDTKQISFTGFFSKLFSSKSEFPESKFSLNDIPNEFAAEISSGIKNVMDCNIPVQNFKCIMPPDELREILPYLTQENFLATDENQNNGIYCIDLDYQTSFSSGNENIFDILDNVAQYANRYYEKNGKDFIFALTDRDSIEGLQHALRIIGSNPDKFKHVRFVPGIKMSFAHEAPNSNLGYENSDMLIYGINPFSKNVMDFVETTVQKRKNMTINFIKQVNQLYPEFAYSVLEFAQQNRIKYKKGFCVSNLYWRAREYAETKGDTAIKGISMVPDEILSEAEEILNELDQVFLGSNQRGYSALGSEIIKDEEVNKSIKEVFSRYSTHYDDESGKVVSEAENLYDDMIECLSREPQKPILALASPYYFSHYYEAKDPDTFDKVVKFIENLRSRSNDMLIAFESVAPSYDIDSNLSTRSGKLLDKYRNRHKINLFNEYIRRNTNLYEVGGSFANRNIKLPS